MNILKTGQFYGTTNQILQLDGLTITDTEYTHPVVDWHYHENAYFTFLLQGNVLEGNKKEVYHCSAGDLLFHNWQDAHYNRKPKGFTRGFHIELNQDWFNRYDIKNILIEGSINIKQPAIKLMMYRLFATTKQDGIAAAAIDSQLIELLSVASGSTFVKTKDRLRWVKLLEQLLHEEPDSYLFSLSELAHRIGVHPIHLSRAFSIYFGCNLGDYLRQIKLQRALGLLANENNTLTTIAAECGFADQSHFIRSFKMNQRMTPLTFRKLMKRC